MWTGSSLRARVEGPPDAPTATVLDVRIVVFPENIRSGGGVVDQPRILPQRIHTESGSDIRRTDKTLSPPRSVGDSSIECCGEGPR